MATTKTPLWKSILYWLWLPWPNTFWIILGVLQGQPLLQKNGGHTSGLAAGLWLIATVIGWVVMAVEIAVVLFLWWLFR